MWVEHALHMRSVEHSWDLGFEVYTVTATPILLITHLHQYSLPLCEGTENELCSLIIFSVCHLELVFLGSSIGHLVT